VVAPVVTAAPPSIVVAPVVTIPLVSVPAPAPAPAAAPIPTPPPSWVAAPTPAPAIPSRLQVELVPQPYAMPSAADTERRRKLSKARGMIAGGWATLGTMYLLSSLVGVVAIDTASSQRGRNFGGWMLVPVVGPYGAAFHTRSFTGAYFTAMLGAAQTVGFVLAMVGHRRKRRLERELSLAVAPAPGGGAVGMRMRF
jgi:hypothetical protein